MKQSSTIFLYFFSITLKADFKSILFVSFRRTAHRYKEKMTADSFCQYRHLSFKNIFLNFYFILQENNDHKSQLP